MPTFRNAPSVKILDDSDAQIGGASGTPIWVVLTDPGGTEIGRVRIWDGTTVALVAAGGNLQTSSLHRVASAATLANIASSASSVTLQASNTSRRGWLCFNDSTQILYIKFGATASTTSYVVQVPPSGYYELPLPAYTGVIDGIWAAANGNARVTELT